MLSKISISTNIKSFLKNLKIIRLLAMRDNWIYRLGKCDVLLLGHENDRGHVVDEKCYSQIIDSLRFYLENNNISCESVSLPFNTNRSFINYYPYSILDREILWQILCSVILSFFQNKKKFRDVSFVRVKKVWIKILKRSCPSTVIAIHPHKSLCAACFELGINIYDYQHGVVAWTHPLYIAKFYNETTREKLPTGYLCWNEDSASRLRNWGSQYHLSVIVLGQPWLNRFINNDKNDMLIKREKNTHCFSANERKNILVTLQPKLDNQYPNFFKKNEVINSVLARVIKKSKEVNWLIRLHPMQNSDPRLKVKIAEQFAENSNVFITWPTKAPLPIVIAQCVGHITWNSAVIVEAAMLGVRSYLLNPVDLFDPKLVGIERMNEKKIIQSSLQYNFVFEERMGMVERAIKEPKEEYIKKWVNKVLMEPAAPENRTTLFDTQELLNLVK